MRKILALIILLGVGYFGYRYFKKTSPPPASPTGGGTVDLPPIGKTYKASEIPSEVYLAMPLAVQKKIVAEEKREEIVKATPEPVRKIFSPLPIGGVIFLKG